MHKKTAEYTYKVTISRLLVFLAWEYLDGALTGIFEISRSSLCGSDLTLRRSCPIRYASVRMKSQPLRINARRRRQRAFMGHKRPLLLTTDNSVTAGPIWSQRVKYTSTMQ